MSAHRVGDFLCDGGGGIGRGSVVLDIVAVEVCMFLLFGLRREDRPSGCCCSSAIISEKK